MARRMVPTPLPNDKAFSARSVNDEQARNQDAKRVGETDLEVVLDATNPEKIAYFEARAQHMANQLNCSVLVHYFAIPHFEHTPPTLGAVWVPGNEHAELPQPAK